MSQPEPFLESLRIASPCQESWEKMEGDDRVRFCGTCQKHVYDMRYMSRDEAEDLVRATEKVCVRMTRRADGTVITGDCPVGARDKSRRQKVAGLIGGGLLAATALLAKVRAGAEPATGSVRPGSFAVPVLAELVKRVQDAKPQPQPETVMMGDVAPAPRPMMGAVHRAEPVEPVKPVR